MGLLTNPNTTGTNKLLLGLKNHNGKVGFLTFVIGLVWIAVLANRNYNIGIYFSENALLPGLVVENFEENNRVDHYMNTLIRVEHNGVIQPEEFISIFRDMGFTETEMQNYTIVHPIISDPGSVIHGTNVYAVLRGKRAAGTESLVFNAPYFVKNSYGKRNLVGIATMLAVAEYFQKQVYWAKDIVFLVAEGHMGSLAWVKGHQEIRDNNQKLIVDNVGIKVGNIQAAINFVLESAWVCHMEAKYHGVNGQLPNLDLVNLLNKFIIFEYDLKPLWVTDIMRLVNYMQIQGKGSPTGSHGYFLQYGIESVTLIGRSTGRNCKRGTAFTDVGRTLEAIFRSLNNLLEKFHQSFFFYLKTSENRFISIGLYFPPLALILFAIPLKAACIWLSETDLEATNGLFFVGFLHCISIGCRWILSHMNQILPATLEMTPDRFTHLVLGLSLFQILVAQAVMLKWNGKNFVSAVYCFTLLEFATALFSLALFNPSLVFLVGSCTVPIVTVFFFFQPSRRTWFSIGILAVLIGSVIYDLQSGSWIGPWVNKYFYEAEIYGNFLFDSAFVLGIPVLSSFLATL